MFEKAADPLIKNNSFSTELNSEWPSVKSNYCDRGRKNKHDWTLNIWFKFLITKESAKKVQAKPMLGPDFWIPLSGPGAAIGGVLTWLPFSFCAV